MGYAQLVFPSTPSAGQVIKAIAKVLTGETVLANIEGLSSVSAVGDVVYASEIYNPSGHAWTLAYPASLPGAGNFVIPTVTLKSECLSSGKFKFVRFSIGTSAGVFTEPAGGVATNYSLTTNYTIYGQGLSAVDGSGNATNLTYRNSDGSSAFIKKATSTTEVYVVKLSWSNRHLFCSAYLSVSGNSTFLGCFEHDENHQTSYTSAAPCLHVTGFGATSTLSNYTADDAGDWNVVSVLNSYNTLLAGTSTLPAVNGTSLLTCAKDTFIDLSSNGHAITVAGNTVVSSSAPISGAWSNYFDGNGDYLSTPSSAAYNFGTGDFTIEAWVYIAGNSSPDGGGNRIATIISAHNGITPPTATSQGWDLIIGGNASTTGTSLFFENFSAGAYTSTGTSFSIPQTTWHHIAMTRQSGVVRFFLNGVQQGANASFTSSVSGGAANCWVGAFNYPSFIRYFNGYISNLRVVKGTALYTGNFTVPTLSNSWTLGVRAITTTSSMHMSNIAELGMASATSNEHLTRAYKANNRLEIPTAPLYVNDTASQLGIINCSKHSKIFLFFNSDQELSSIVSAESGATWKVWRLYNAGLTSFSTILVPYA